MNSQKELVSIIIPTYNCEKYIAYAVESCLAQSYRNIEIIVVDDGSHDNTESVLSKYKDDRRLKYIYQENKGLPGARNTGIINSRGEYIQFLDSDDILEPTKIEKQLSFLRENKEYFGVYCRSFLFNESKPGYFYEPKHKVRTGLVQKYLVCGNIMPVNAPLTRRDDLLFDEELLSCEDWDYWFRLFDFGRKLGHINEALCYVRRHPTNMTKNRQKMLYYDIKVLNKIVGIKEYKAAANFELFKRFLYSKLLINAIKSLCKAIICDIRYLFIFICFVVLIPLKGIKKVYMNLKKDY